MHVPVLAEASRPRAPTSVAWIPLPTRAADTRRRHRDTHTWMASFSVEHTFDIVNVSRMIVCPRLLLSSILCADKITARYNSLLRHAQARLPRDRAPRPRQRRRAHGPRPRLRRVPRAPPRRAGPALRAVRLRPLPPGLRAADQRQPASVPALRAAGGGTRRRRRRGARGAVGAGGPDGGARRGRRRGGGCWRGRGKGRRGGEGAVRAREAAGQVPRVPRRPGAGRRRRGAGAAGQRCGGARGGVGSGGAGAAEAEGGDRTAEGPEEVRA